MSTIMHKSELVRRAMVYLDECISMRPQACLQDLLDEAGMRFNLNPKEAADLERCFRERCNEQKLKRQ